MRRTLVGGVRWCLLILLVLLTGITSRSTEALDNAGYEKFVDIGGVLVGMTFDDHGNLFVAKDLHDIIHITPDGQTTHFLTIKDDQFSTSRIRDMTVGPDNHLYVAEDRRIVKISSKKVVETVIRLDFTSGQGGLRAIVFDAKGNLYAAYDAKVDKYSPSFEREVFFDETRLNINVAVVSGLAFDTHSQHLIMADGRNHALLKFPISPDGTLEVPQVFDELESSQGSWAIGENGDIFTAIWGEATLVRIDPQGMIEKIPCPLETLSGFATLAFGRHGFDEDALYIGTRDGQIFTFHVNTREATP